MIKRDRFVVRANLFVCEEVFSSISGLVWDKSRFCAWKFDDKVRLKRKRI